MAWQFDKKGPSLYPHKVTECKNFTYFLTLRMQLAESFEGNSYRCTTSIHGTCTGSQTFQRRKQAWRIQAIQWLATIVLCGIQANHPTRILDPKQNKVESRLRYLNKRNGSGDSNAEESRPQIIKQWNLIPVQK